MLEVKNLRKRYKTSKKVVTEALNDVSLKFGDKGMVFVLGKSGSGKSTLLNVLGGLDTCDSGEIIINGKTSSTFKQSDYDSYRNTYIGFIFQEFNVIDNFTIGKNIALALQLQQKEASSDTINDILKKVDLEGYADRYPNELSGGQKQRVAIARALVKNPEIIMADEPTGALDSSTGEQIFDTLKELSKEKLVIVVSHDRDAAEKYADRIIEFKDGKVISDTDDSEDSEIATQEETGKEFKVIKSHLPMADAFKLGITSLKHKKIRLVFSIILTVFALTMLGISDGISSFDEISAHIKAMRDNGQEIISIRKNRTSDNSALFNSPVVLTDSDIKDISSTAKQEVIKTYSVNNDGTPLTSSSLGISYKRPIPYYYSTLENSELELVEISDLSKMKIKNYQGNMAKNNDEIVISSLLADHIIYYGIGNYKPTSYKQIIDDAHKISLNGIKDVKIVGIAEYDLSKYNELKNQSSTNTSSSKSDELEESLKNFRISSEGANRIYVCPGFVDALDVPENLFISNEYVKLSIGDNSVNTEGILQGYKPNKEYFDGVSLAKKDSIKDDEIILNLADCLTMLGYEEVPSDFENVAKQNIIGKKLTMSTDQLLYSGLLLKDSLDKKEFTVIGVTNDITEPTTISRNLALSIATPSKGLFGVYVSTDDKTVLNDILTKYPPSGELYSSTRYSSELALASIMSKGLSKIFFWVSIVLLAFAIMLTTNFIITSISFRKKEIGILRAIGARTMDVLKIFIWEGISLSTISFIVASGLMFWLANVLNNFISTNLNLSVSFIIMSIRQPLVLIACLIVVTLLSSLLPIIKLSRQKPIDTIKK